MRLNEVLLNYDDPVICAYDANLVDVNLRDPHPPHSSGRRDRRRSG